MAQTTGGMSFRNAVIEISTDGTTWTDISGVANKIKVKGPERKSGSAHTASGDKPIVTVGKLEQVEVEMDIVYSEVTTEAYNVLEGYLQNATGVKVRWAPKGTATGNFRYTTDTGYITELPPPAGDFDKADPVMVTTTHVSSGYTKAAI